MLRELEFVHRGHLYRASVQPVPGGADEFKLGAWFVSMDDGPERRVFEANDDDADTEDFRSRLVIATWLTEGYNRRVSDRRQEETVPAGDERRGESDRRGPTPEF